MRPIPLSSVPTVLLLLLATVLGFLALWADPTGSTATDAVGIGTLRTRPADFWRRTVRVVGVARDVGKNRYALVDRGGESVTIQAAQPPRDGAEVLVVAIVGQDPENARNPLLVELDREAMRRSVRSVLFALLVVLVASASGIALVVSTDRRLRRATLAQQGGSSAPVDASPLLRLEVVQGPDQGKVFELEGSEVTIGRPGDRSNRVALSDMTISRTQGRVVRDDKRFVFQNESATNPSRINGQAVTRGVLAAGDRIEMGETVLRVAFAEPPAGLA
jgi:Inner membrane component of T3SS, cytoplasmic domain